MDKLPHSPAPSFNPLKGVELSKYACPSGCGVDLPAVLGISKQWLLLLKCHVCQKVYGLCLICKSARIVSLTHKRNHYILHQNKEKHASAAGIDLPMSISNLTNPTSSRKRNLPSHSPTRSEADPRNNLPVSPRVPYYTSPLVSPVTNNHLLSSQSVHRMILHNQPWMPKGHKAIVKSSNLGFQLDKNSSYYQGNCHQMSNHSKNAHQGGKSILVKQVLMKQKLNPDAANTMDTPQQQIDLYIKLAKLANTLPRTEHQLLAEVVQGCYKLDPSGIHMESKFPIRLPENENDIRNDICRGQYSIVENLPSPEIRWLPGHAYVLPSDCIRDFLAQPNADLTLMENVKSSHGLPPLNHISQSPRAIRVLANSKQTFGDEPTTVLYVIFWSDGAGCGSSCVGDPQTSLWCCTMTIGTSPAVRNRAQNTYPIAISASKADHQNLFSVIAKDMEQFSKKETPAHYIGCTNSKSRVYAEVLAVLGDQPERRGNNGLMGTASLYGLRFGVSANHVALYPQLRACDSCYTLMCSRLKAGNYVLGLPECDKCLNWDSLLDSPLAHTPLPSDYPPVAEVPSSRHVVHNGRVMLRSFEVTYQTMTEALGVAHRGYSERNWNLKKLRKFMQVECLSTELQDKVVDRAGNAKSINTATLPEDVALLSAHREANPDLYEPVPPLAAWLRPHVDLRCNVEAVMHILFLGIAKSIALMIQRSLTLRYANATFLNVVGGYLDKLVKSFSVEWLKLKPYTGKKFGGYLSENYIALARISHWFYQNYDTAMSDDEEAGPKSVPPPGKKLEDYTIKNNQYWLRIRGLGYGDCKSAAQYKERVGNFARHVPVPPIIPVPEVSGDDISRLVLAQAALLECALTSDVDNNTVMKLNYVIRILICEFDKLDTKMRATSTDKPTVLSKANFLCLMNFPMVMQEFGTIVDLYEGKVQGEGYFPDVKTAYNHGSGMREGWERNMMKTIYESRALGNMLHTDDSKEHPKHASDLKKHRSMFQVYDSKALILGSLSQNATTKKLALSVVIVAEENSQTSPRLFAVCSREHNHVVEINLHHNVGHSALKAGTRYFLCSTEAALEDAPLIWSRDVAPTLNNPRYGFGMLLPILNPNGRGQPGYFSLISRTFSILSLENTIDGMVDKYAD